MEYGGSCSRGCGFGGGFALRAGAISYVLKDIEPNQLVETVRRGVQGESIMHPRVAARVVNEIRATKQASPNPFSELSEREFWGVALFGATIAYYYRRRGTCKYCKQI
ncbi:hypothetical protein [Bacillus cereus]|uniref:hypothetical protein n=1 Tax=Bacillus cereus TaxID=1396 RepID=UPI0020D253A3